MQILDSGYKHVVNLPINTCDCTNFREYSSPCTHAIVACKYIAEDPFDYVNFKYSIEALRETYKHFLVLISIENLPTDEDILPLVAKKQCRRPKTKRIRKNAWKK